MRRIELRKRIYKYAKTGLVPAMFALALFFGRPLSVSADTVGDFTVEGGTQGKIIPMRAMC